ncbi:MAG: hypothetical protein AAF327_13845 [Cyanobacteria bacterium P01_A01_bin.37]
MSRLKLELKNELLDIAIECAQAKQDWNHRVLEFCKELGATGFRPCGHIACGGYTACHLIFPDIEAGESVKGLRLVRQFENEFEFKPNLRTKLGKGIFDKLSSFGPRPEKRKVFEYLGLPFPLEVGNSFYSPGMKADIPNKKVTLYWLTDYPAIDLNHSDIDFAGLEEDEVE